MDDLIAFVAARLDDDEAVAQAAAHSGAVWTQRDPVRNPGYIDAERSIVVYDEGYPDEDQAPHIARHDPARVLREVAAKRAILALHGPAEINKYGRPEPRCPVCLSGRAGYQEDWHADSWPCRTLCLLAAAWSDHPDCRQEWA